MRSSILTLQSLLDQAKERLKDVEENIKKSTGRDFTQNQTNRQVFKRTARQFEETDGGQAGGVPFKKRISDVKGRLGDWVTEDRPNSTANQRPGFGSQRSVIPIQGRIVTRTFQQVQGWDRESKVEELSRIPARKRLDPAPNSNQSAVTVFSRLSGPPKEEEVEKVKVTSQVLVQESPSRKEILVAQSKDKSCKERNRRMFGALMGTLQKFRQEESKLKEKEEKKAQVERKVEEAAEREKEEAKKARRELFTSRRQEQLNIRHLEFKITKLQQLSKWEANKNKLLPFIQTDAQPRIFYLPKRHNDKTKALLENHQIKIERAIEKKRAEIEKLIEDHVSPADEGKDEDGETAMDIDDNNERADEDDDSAPLMPSAIVKRERDSSSDSDDSDDSVDRCRRNRSTTSSESDSSDDGNRVKIKLENDRQASDKENLVSQQSPDIKIKIEAT